MLRIQPVDRLDLPGLEPYRTLKLMEEHREKGIFVAQGEKVFSSLLDSECAIVSVLLSQELLKKFRPALEARKEIVDIFIGDKGVLKEVVGHSMYQAILAVGRVPRMPTLESMLMSLPRPYLIAALDGLSNADNIGATVRNAAAMGVQGIVVGETCSSPWVRRAVRSSMGGILGIPCAEVSDLAQAVHDLGSQGLQTVACHPRPDCKSIDEVDFKQDTCVVLGSEGLGIRESVLESCTVYSAIPINPEIDSLNVANAAAIYFYEAQRQRGYSFNPSI
ncbi:RNA methyltransferase [Verrucomicrobia bacterium]|nr:RNA methyltransferase [Verrucomicrobiota bacterium]